MKKIKFVRFLFLALGLITLATPCFSIEAYVSALYRELDIAFGHKSTKEINSILAYNTKDPNYYLLENYTMKKIRHLLIKEDYQFAMQVNLIVIDNDLDNIDAVDMYTTIVSALKKQQEKEEMLAEQERQRLAKLEAEKAKKQNVIEKDFATVTTADGNTVYLNEADKKYSAVFWNLRFGMADIGIESDANSGYNSVRYGICGDFTYEYSFDKLLIGADLGVEAIVLSLTNDDKTMLGSAYFAPKIAYNPISRIFFLRAGINADLKFENEPQAYLGEIDEPSTLRDTFVSPLIGLGFSKLRAGSLLFGGGLDYYPMHFADDDLHFAMGGNFCVNIPFVDMETVKLGFTIGLKETFFVKSSGVENRARIILAIGAENVAK